MSIKNSNDTIGNRTLDLPACRAVPQRTAPPSVPHKRKVDDKESPFGGREQE